MTVLWYDGALFQLLPSASTKSVADCRRLKVSLTAYRESQNRDVRIGGRRNDETNAGTHGEDENLTGRRVKEIV